ncbi:hypothetical protein J6590_101530, partial [Homalodisca vitripennis]
MAHKVLSLKESQHLGDQEEGDTGIRKGTSVLEALCKLVLKRTMCTHVFVLQLRLPEWLSDQSRAIEKIALHDEEIDFWKEKGEGPINNINYLIIYFGNQSLLGWNYLMGVIEENYKSKTPTSPYDYLRLLSLLTKTILSEKVPPIYGELGSRTVSVAKIINDLIINFSDYDNFFQKDVMVTETDLAEIATSLFFCQRGFLESLVYSLDEIKKFNVEPMQESYIFGRTGVMKNDKKKPWTLGKAMVEATAESSLYGR